MSRTDAEKGLDRPCRQRSASEVIPEHSPALVRPLKKFVAFGVFYRVNSVPRQGSTMKKWGNRLCRARGPAFGRRRIPGVPMA